MSKKSYDHIFKILLVGDSNVGKSSILNTYFDQAFTESLIPTVGVDFRIKTFDLNGKKIKLQIW